MSLTAMLQTVCLAVVTKSKYQSRHCSSTLNPTLFINMKYNTICELSQDVHDTIRAWTHTDTSFDCDFNHVKAWVVTKAQRSQRYRAMLRVIK